jgi:predicted TIM-barrel fold metal-dependent hydrolase
MTAPVIDFRVRLPDEMRPEIDVPPEVWTQYQEVLGVQDKLKLGFEDLKRGMNESGVSHSVIHAEYEIGDPADAMNEKVAELVKADPKRFSGVGTVSMEHFKVMRAVEQVRRCADLGLVGISLQPSFFRMPICDRTLYPVYAKAAECGLIVALHTGINYGVTHPMRHDDPLQLDDLACDFPDLKLIAAHAGWPWVPQMVAVARKHPNVYMEFGGLAPKYVGASGTGWEVMRRFMDSVCQDQSLYGTDWPVMNHERTLAEWREMGLKPQVEEKLLGGNAARLLGR